MSRLSVSRRRFLTAVGATALTYPFLRALPGYAGGDNKYLILIFTPNGVVRNFWGADPGATPGSFTLRSWLAPLAKYQSQMVVVRGLCNKAAGIGDPHGPGMASLWTGLDVASQTVGPGGPSIDQVIAASLKAPTPQSSIAFRATSPQDYQGKSIYNRMIYDALGNQVDPYDNPTATLSELFLGIGADAGAADAGPDPQVVLRQRVIARLNGELGRVMPKLCNEDRQQLDALQTGLNTLTKNLGTTGMGALQSCGQPMITGGVTYPQIVQDTINLLSMSVACDLSRVISLQFSQALSPMVPDFLMSGGNAITTDHHSLSHEAPHRFQVGPNAPTTSDADDPTPAQIASCQPACDQLTAIYQWYASQIAALCDALSAIPAGNGKTLLDQSLICWGNELDNGSDHDHWELPIVLLGGAGGALKTGQLVQYPIFNGYGLPEDAKYMAKRAHNDLHVTLAQLMGVNMTTFGNPAYNVGPLTEILA
jgi:Protein of unknown function (DUF1552)